MTATKDIIVTLGPSSLNEAIVKKLDDSGVTFLELIVPMSV